MANVYSVSERMHKMRSKLYPSYLPGTEGSYIARTDSEASLNVAQVCSAAISRGGVECDLDDFTEYVNKYN